MERRDRLKRLVAERDIPLATTMGDGGKEVVVAVSAAQRELFHTEGTEELLAARMQFANWSLKRAKERILSAKRKREALAMNPEVRKK